MGKVQCIGHLQHLQRLGTTYVAFLNTITIVYNFKQLNCCSVQTDFIEAKRKKPTFIHTACDILITRQRLNLFVYLPSIITTHSSSKDRPSKPIHVESIFCTRLFSCYYAHNKICFNCKVSASYLVTFFLSRILHSGRCSIALCSKITFKMEGVVFAHLVFFLSVFCQTPSPGRKFLQTLQVGKKVKCASHCFICYSFQIKLEIKTSFGSKTCFMSVSTSACFCIYSLTPFDLNLKGLLTLIKIV